MTSHTICEAKVELSKGGNAPLAPWASPGTWVPAVVSAMKHLQRIVRSRLAKAKPQQMASLPERAPKRVTAAQFSRLRKPLCQCAPERVRLQRAAAAPQAAR